MNTQQLECFIFVAEYLNFARAAKALHITQPAVSRQIQSLEEELGARLLHRTTRTVTLTPAGVSFLRDANDILNKMNDAAARVRHNYLKNLPFLSVGCYDGVDLTTLPSLLDKLRRIAPDIRPDVHIVPHKYILDQLTKGSLDIILGFQENAPFSRDIGYQELIRLNCCCVIPSGHPFSARVKIREEELLAENLIFCNSFRLPASIINLQNRLRPLFPPPSVTYCDSVQVALALIKSGLGFAILPQLKKDSDPDLVSIPIAGTTPMSYGLFYFRQTQNTLLQKFLTKL
ncbi:MAG: LysR family transcriptional regulator [Lachnospiraceae bacterium]|nr:LysR family transcriptional regulator [Lachnospiraceae bacterium]